MSLIRPLVHQSRGLKNGRAPRPGATAMTGITPTPPPAPTPTPPSRHHPDVLPPCASLFPDSFLLRPQISLDLGGYSQTVTVSRPQPKRARFSPNGSSFAQCDSVRHACIFKLAGFFVGKPEQGISAYEQKYATIVIRQTLRISTCLRYLYMFVLLSIAVRVFGCKKNHCSGGHLGRQIRNSGIRAGSRFLNFRPRKLGLIS